MAIVPLTSRNSRRWVAAVAHSPGPVRDAPQEYSEPGVRRSPVGQSIWSVAKSGEN